MLKEDTCGAVISRLFGQGAALGNEIFILGIGPRYSFVFPWLGWQGCTLVSHLVPLRRASLGPNWERSLRRRNSSSSSRWKITETGKTRSSPTEDHQERHSSSGSCSSLCPGLNIFGLSGLHLLVSLPIAAKKSHITSTFQDQKNIYSVSHCLDICSQRLVLKLQQQVGASGPQRPSVSELYQCQADDV